MYIPSLSLFWRHGADRILHGNDRNLKTQKHFPEKKYIQKRAGTFRFHRHASCGIESS